MTATPSSRTEPRRATPRSSGFGSGRFRPDLSPAPDGLGAGGTAHRPRSMLTDRVEAKWIDCFERTLALCAVGAGDAVAILSETQSRPLNVHLTELALARLGARAFHVVVPTPAQTAPVPIRSTGASDALGGLAPAIAALAASTLVVDLTVEGMLHAPELPRILDGGARLLMVSNEHPDALERLVPDPALEQKSFATATRARTTAGHSTWSSKARPLMREATTKAAARRKPLARSRFEGLKRRAS